jgi:hypothetical protein
MTRIWEMWCFSLRNNATPQAIDKTLRKYVKVRIDETGASRAEFPARKNRRLLNSSRRAGARCQASGAGVVEMFSRRTRCYCGLGKRKLRRFL